MVFSGKKQCLCFAFTAYLVLALIGAPTFSIAENLRFDEPMKNQLTSGGFFTAASHTIDWLIEDTKTIGNSNGHYYFPVRNGMPRIFMPTEIQNTAIYFAGLLLQTARNNPSPIEINAAPLKLRI
jgi:hypothetical protein